MTSNLGEHLRYEMQSKSSGRRTDRRIFNHLVDKLAVLGSPADLHDAAGHDLDLVVPDAFRHGQGAPGAFERRRVTPAGKNHRTVNRQVDEVGEVP